MALRIFKPKYQIFIICIGITMVMTLNGQNLDKYQWKNRIVLIISSDSESDTFTAQIEAFDINSRELEERKLLIYRVLTDKYKIENTKDTSWIKDSKLYATYNPTDKNFSIVLIGLDGNVKTEQSNLLTATALFSIIDAMPMRRNEIRDNKK
tara:strand:+ start:351 stop:806 length:456 start_codon:yes stop_codon:yes gene_type:complete